MLTQRLIAPFWRRRWLILTTTLAVVTGALVWAKSLPAVYESSLTLAANSKDGTSIPPGQLARVRQGLYSKSMYYRLAASSLFDDQRAAGLSNDALVEQLQRSIGLTEHSYGTSAVIQLRSFDTKPERAQMVAAAFGKSIEENDAQNVSGNSAIAFRVEQPAAAVPRTVKPRLGVVTVFALGGGILTAFILAAVSELVRRRRSPEVGSAVA